MQTWPQQAIPKQPAAHAGGGLIEYVHQRRFFGLTGEQRFEQLQIADCDRVENHRASAVVKRGRLDVIERGFLRLTEIMEDGARGRDRERSPTEAATVERQQPEVFLQRAIGVVEAEDPVVERGSKTRQRGTLFS